jgi:PPIC-type PPIASE domain
MRRVVAAAATVLSIGCGDAFTSKVTVVAQVGPYELPVERLAEIMATSKGLPLQRPVVEGVAQMWVDYTILADRLVAGDSLLDSGYVVAGMWAEIQQEIAHRYHSQLVARWVHLDSAQVDSAYAGSQYRFIKHILFGVPQDASNQVRRVKRRVAEDTYNKLTKGTLTWSKAATANEDPQVQDSEGSLGVIAHGEQEPPIENAAFALAPGAISPVTETAEGYHILWRPPLAAVRDQFRTALQDRLEADFDTTFLAGLPARWDLTVRPGIGPAVRELGQDALRAKESGKLLGTYKGGQFRVSDLARWLQAMPMGIRQQLPAASDSQVTLLVSSLMRNEVLLREARDSGAVITPEFQAEMKDQLRRQVSLVSALLGFPSDTLAALRVLAPTARQKLVQSRVLAYLEAIAREDKRLQTVPPFLADTLRAEADWKLVPAGVEQVLDRARRLRGALDSMPSRTPPPPMTSPVAPRDSAH